jgi:tetratricopeptide (TPR) repeat protein
MFDARFSRTVLPAALLTMLMAPFAFPGPAHAQSDEDESKATNVDSPIRARIDNMRKASEARKARTTGKQDKDAATTTMAPRYPQATRAEPPAKATAAATPILKKIIDAYNKSDAATVTGLADAVIADPKANAYDHAFAARMGGVAVLQSNPAKSMQYLKQALLFNGLSNNEHYESMLVLAQLQMQADQYGEGLTTLDRFFAETHSQEPESLALKGNALYRLKRYPEAAASLKQAIAASPQPHADWMQLLMGTYLDTNQPAEAARVADELIAKNPNDKGLQMNLASVYIGAGKNDKAAAILEKLRATGQLTDEKDYRNLYALYFNLPGKEKEAIEIINDGMKKGVLKPDYQTYAALAQGYYFSKQPALAIEAYKKAAPLAPDGEVYLNLAKALSNEGRKAEARQAAQQALDKGVKNPAEARKLVGQKGK